MPVSPKCEISLTFLFITTGCLYLSWSSNGLFYTKHLCWCLNGKKGRGKLAETRQQKKGEIHLDVKVFYRTLPLELAKEPGSWTVIMKRKSHTPHTPTFFVVSNAHFKNTELCILIPRRVKGFASVSCNRNWDKMNSFCFIDLYFPLLP